MFYFFLFHENRKSDDFFQVFLGLCCSGVGWIWTMSYCTDHFCCPFPSYDDCSSLSWCSHLMTFCFQTKQTKKFFTTSAFCSTSTGSQYDISLLCRCWWCVSLTRSRKVSADREPSSLSPRTIPVSSYPKPHRLLYQTWRSPNPPSRQMIDSFYETHCSISNQ